MSMDPTDTGERLLDPEGLHNDHSVVDERAAREIEAAWTKVAKSRLDAIRSGGERVIASDVVDQELAEIIARSVDGC